MGLNRPRPIPKFWYVTDKEHEKIRKFYEKHLHSDEYKNQTISRVPYSLHIIPNSVSYSVTVRCDVCEKKSVSEYPDLEWYEDVTDYDDW